MTGTPPPPPPFGGGPPPPPFGDGQPSPQYPPGYGGDAYGAPGYGPPGYGPPGYGPPGFSRPAERANGMSIASLVLGIIALPLCFVGLPALLAVIFGIVGIVQCNRDRNYSGRGMAIAGLVLGAIAILLALLVVVWLNSLDPSTWEIGE